ncbi:MAG TPA: nitrous oxide reductase accessory protein NosL [Saprospiraceae bacterium]|nr:nitrous oxide reductase accessory protein NosL [Saprospiraceae bacterium]
MNKTSGRILIFCIMVLNFTSCSYGPQPIRFGKDACSHCMMTIMDPKFGGEIVTQKGKIYMFDDINCMIRFTGKEGEKVKTQGTFYTLDFSNPPTLIPADQAYYILSDIIKSPMASRVAAFGNEVQRDSFFNQWNENGILLQWEEIVDRFERQIR